MNMMQTTRTPRRRGAIAAFVAFFLVVIIGMIAYAFDTGWIALTRTQLHAGADSASLAGGTELLPGLGLLATATPSEVQTAATAAAVEFAGRNRNGDRSSCYCNGGRDVLLGTAVFNPGQGRWIKSQGATPYNYVQVDLHRDQAGSGAGDGLLPLFFARIFGIDEAPAAAFATAVILPANGFTIDEGSDDTVGLMPFAFREEIWRRMERAQEYYENVNPGALSMTAEEHLNLLDVEGQEPDQPLFGESYEGEPYDVEVETPGPDGEPVIVTETVTPTIFNQLFFDFYTVSDDGGVSNGADFILEVKVYTEQAGPGQGPDPNSDGGAGNFGTVDIGDTNNSTQELMRQIRYGLNADDLSHYEDNTLTIAEDDPLDAEGDTGVSGGIENAIESIIGDCRAIVLFSATNDEAGNNYIYTLVDIVGATVVDVDLHGNPKYLYVQPCTFVDDNATGDTDQEIGENETAFTPLILIE